MRTKGVEWANPSRNTLTPPPHRKSLLSKIIENRSKTTFSMAERIPTWGPGCPLKKLSRYAYSESYGENVSDISYFTGFVRVQNYIIRPRFHAYERGCKRIWMESKLRRNCFDVAWRLYYSKVKYVSTLFLQCLKNYTHFYNNYYLILS